MGNECLNSSPVSVQHLDYLHEAPSRDVNEPDKLGLKYNNVSYTTSKLTQDRQTGKDPNYY